MSLALFLALRFAVTAHRNFQRTPERALYSLLHTADIQCLFPYAACILHDLDRMFTLNRAARVSSSNQGGLFCCTDVNYRKVQHVTLQTQKTTSSFNQWHENTRSKVLLTKPHSLMYCMMNLAKTQIRKSHQKQHRQKRAQHVSLIRASVVGQLYSYIAFT